MSAAPVPESVLKKRKSLEQAKAQRAQKLAALRVKRKSQRKVFFVRAEKYLKEYRQQERSLIRQRRVAKQGRNFFREPEAKLAFVIRIRG
jgi:large subunit ribosomal protein L7e